MRMFTCLVFKRGKEIVEIVSVLNVFLVIIDSEIEIMDTPKICIYMNELRDEGFKEGIK